MGLPCLSTRIKIYIFMFCIYLIFPKKMYFWRSIVWIVQTQCLFFFHYVPGFFLKYKKGSSQICVCHCKVNFGNEHKMGVVGVTLRLKR